MGSYEAASPGRKLRASPTHSNLTRAATECLEILRQLSRNRLLTIPMLFNSLHFLIFFPLAVILYFAVPQRFRWIPLVCTGYYFYASWRAEYLILIVFSTVIDYWVALRMGACSTRDERRPYLLISLAVNLGLLAAFKYANFAASFTAALFGGLHIQQHVPVLSVVLPVGLSFYTFQEVAYTIDVYRGIQKPERHLGVYAAFISFFPQLVAGPIGRAGHMLPQFHRPHPFRYEHVTSGLRRMCWGFFKKLVLADQASLIVNAVWAHPEQFPGQTLVLAAYLFVFQLYYDFSAYTDIAVGAARVMGFELMENFRRPLFAPSIRDLWNRWHISLSTWFRDYLYIPLGGKQVSTGRLYLNLMLVLTLAGFWHGAGWNFIVFGGMHGVYLVTSRATAGVRNAAWYVIGTFACRWLRVDVRKFRKPLAIFLTFHLFLLSLIVFRAGPLWHGWVFLSHLPAFDLRNLGLPAVMEPLRMLVLVVAIGAVEGLQYAAERHDLTAAWARVPNGLRWGAYYAAVVIILIVGELGAREFVYFQF